MNVNLKKYAKAPKFTLLGFSNFIFLMILLYKFDTSVFYIGIMKVEKLEYSLMLLNPTVHKMSLSGAFLFINSKNSSIWDNIYSHVA